MDGAASNQWRSAKDICLVVLQNVRGHFVRELVFDTGGFWDWRSRRSASKRDENSFLKQITNLEFMCSHFITGILGRTHKQPQTWHCHTNLKMWISLRPSAHFWLPTGTDQNGSGWNWPPGQSEHRSTRLHWMTSLHPINNKIKFSENYLGSTVPTIASTGWSSPLILVLRAVFPSLFL